MNAIDFLKADNQHIEKLFDEVEDVENFFEKQELFQKLKRDLDFHMYLEESHLYPLIEDKFGFEDLIDRVLDCHQEIRNLIDNIESVEEEDEFSDLFRELSENVQDHIEMEEEDLLPRITGVLSNEEFKQLGMQLEEARKSAEAA